MFLGHFIYSSSTSTPDIDLGQKKDWHELKQLSHIKQQDMRKVELLFSNWTLYEKGWFISSSQAFYDTLFGWLTQTSLKRPYELDIIYQKH